MGCCPACEACCGDDEDDRCCPTCEDAWYTMQDKANAKMERHGLDNRQRLLFWHGIDQLKEQIIAVLPITLLIVSVIGIFFRQPTRSPAEQAYGLVCAIFGLLFFMEGLRIIIMPLGEMIGTRLPAKVPKWVVLLVAGCLGTLVTYAEPALASLGPLAKRIDRDKAPYLYFMLNQKRELLLMSIAVGAGVAAVLGTLRFLRGWSIKPLIYLSLAPTMALACYMYWGKEDLRPLLGLAWDCGAITTGPVTVPVVLAMGIGVMTNQRQQKLAKAVFHFAVDTNTGQALEGFGVVALASIWPILAVEIMSCVLTVVYSRDDIINMDYGFGDGPMDHSPTREVIFAIRAVSPLIIFLILIILFLMREPLPVLTAYTLRKDQPGADGSKEPTAHGKYNGNDTVHSMSGIPPINSPAGPSYVAPQKALSGSPPASPPLEPGGGYGSSLARGGSAQLPGDVVLGIPPVQMEMATVAPGTVALTVVEDPLFAKDATLTYAATSAFTAAAAQPQAPAAHGDSAGAAFFAAAPGDAADPTAPAPLAPNQSLYSPFAGASLQPPVPGDGEFAAERRRSTGPGDNLSNAGRRNTADGATSEGGESSHVPDGRPTRTMSRSASRRQTDGGFSYISADSQRWMQVPKGLPWYKRHGGLILGAIWAQGGMIAFNVGLTYGFTALGDQAGTVLPAAYRKVEDPSNPDLSNASPYYGYVGGIILVMVVAFLIGFMTTRAEPALRVLGATVQHLSRGAFTAPMLIYAVSVGVGTGMAIGATKILFGVPLIYIILVKYSIAVFMTHFSDEDFTCIAWDSAGVTTGPVTVPFVLSLGIGFSKATGATEGFGILTAASVAPIISVLLTNMLKRPARALFNMLADVVRRRSSSSGKGLGGLTRSAMAAPRKVQKNKGAKYTHNAIQQMAALNAAAAANARLERVTATNNAVNQLVAREAAARGGRGGGATVNLGTAMGSGPRMTEDQTKQQQPAEPATPAFADFSPVAVPDRSYRVNAATPTAQPTTAGGANTAQTGRLKNWARKSVPLW